ncbi:hypothetical protein [Pantoea ananatis]
MKNKKILTSILFSLFIFSNASVASTISATGLSITEAEASLQKKAKDKGVKYNIIGAHYGNYVYLIARVT